MESEKIIVISASKTGFTRRYANWISETLGCAAISISDADIKTLKNYDAIIFGGGLYAGKINGIDFIIKNIEVLKEKKLAVFATGSGKEEAQVIEKIKEMNLKEYQNLPLFYFRSGLNYSRMRPGDKILMAAFKFMLKISGKKEVYESIKNSFDDSNRENITPLIQYVQKGMPLPE